MITFLTGDNSFEIRRAINKIVADFDGMPEKFDASELEVGNLPDLLQGGTLFATNRLVIIRDVSENKKLGDALSGWLATVSDDVHLVLVEPKPDKRTKFWSSIKSVAQIIEHKKWKEYETAPAEKWILDEARDMGATLDKKCARLLIERVGNDQWQLYHALEKLSVLDEITPEAIEQSIDSKPTENVFNLLETALVGKKQKVRDMIKDLEQTEEPYMVLGLLSGQVFQLAALANMDKNSGRRTADIAVDLGVHPYALGKLTSHADRLGQAKVREIVRIFAKTDKDMKSISVDPWVLIEHALIKTASV